MENQTKREYGRLNEKIFLRAIREGKGKVEAGRIAGLRAKDAATIAHTIDEKLANNPQLKKSVLSQYEALEQKLLRAIDKKDLTKPQVNQLIVSMAVVRDKIQLLKGDVTERIATMPRMIIDMVEVEEGVSNNPPPKNLLENK